MPEISRFYGIVIKMFFSDHAPPHFHAVYGEFVGVFYIKTLEFKEGDLPKKAVNLVLEWAKTHQSELLAIWNNKTFRKLPPLL